MYTDIQEQVRVAAVFDRNRIKPRWFIWNGRKHNIQQITYRWKDREGEAPLIYFSVSDGQTLYELSFNQKTLNWRLEKVYVE